MGVGRGETDGNRGKVQGWVLSTPIICQYPNTCFLIVVCRGGRHLCRSKSAPQGRSEGGGGPGVPVTPPL